MAIETIVGFVVNKLGSFLETEAKSLKDISTEVKRIKKELDSMRAFLRDASIKAESSESAKEWVKQVREAAYDIEDVLDDCLLHLMSPHHQEHSIGGLFRRAFHFIKSMNARRRVASQIKEIRIQLEDISSRKERYHKDDQSPSHNAQSDRVSRHRSSARFAEEANLVGIDGKKNELTKWLTKGESSLATIVVVGMGGLGKTTLVGKVYNSEEVKKHFQFRYWTTVSQEFKSQDFLRSLVKKFYERDDEVNKMKNEELIEMLRSYLQQRRYVIVLDDVWEVQDWEWIKEWLPDRRRGSRIIVTTRKNGVAAACTETSADLVYNLQPLPAEDSWTLFCNRAFKHDSRRACPPELKALSEEIVKKSRGLPLAIVTMGSLLSSKPKTTTEWEKMLDELGEPMESIPGLGGLARMKQILLLSFHDLPYYLKPCFLYVTLFPEDYLIKRMRLIRLWTAEGFIEGKERVTAEEVADEYLQELIDRSLIQVAESTDFDTVSTCRVHDVVREIFVAKSRKENFGISFLNPQHATAASGNIRRLSIHYELETAPKEEDFSHLRSLLVFGGYKFPDPLLNRWFSGFRFLRVLDLEQAKLDSFPQQVVKLLHLRFLSLRGTNIHQLPASIGNQRNLETLDLKYTKIRELPTQILNLKQLRHLLVYYYGPLGGTAHGTKVPAGIGNLTSLQKLAYIEAVRGGGLITEVGKLTQLRRLGIVKLRSEDGMDLCASIREMTKLTSLAACLAKDERGILDMQSLTPPPPQLQHLYLRGRLAEPPRWIFLLEHLVRLTLRWSALDVDLLKAFQDLPNLMELKLKGAYTGQALCCDAWGFQKLRALFLQQLEALRLVKVQKGAMPFLRKLNLQGCPMLEKVPVGIEHLTHLKELNLSDTSSTLKESLAMDGGEDYWKIRHIPLVKFSRWSELMKSKTTMDV